MKRMLVLASVVLADMAAPCAPNRAANSWVKIDVSCAGAGCATQGDLVAMDCSARPEAKVAGVTLNSAATITMMAGPQKSGPLCLLTFLDRDANGIASTGDIVSAPTTQTITLMANGTTETAVVLSAVNP
ncbi:MAG TPA: hypothetical protein VMV18_14960 [bacterium]|nr:hypothetical protein [bacterium]